MKIIELSNVSFRRNGSRILSGISWTIRAGEHWALLGANGAGKTTLLKLITGYEWATEGQVEVLGRRFGECHIPKLRRTIGWVSSAIQERIPSRDTALDVVASGYDASLGVYRHIESDEVDRAHATLGLFQMEALAERTYGALSQGERQRVLIARALVNRPRLLILDEPCVGLDPRAERSFLDDLEKLTLRPDTPSIVLVTHHVEEIGPWIGSVLVLKGGAVAACGPKADLLTNAVLSEAFNCRCRVDFDGDRYWLRLDPPVEPATVVP